MGGGRSRIGVDKRSKGRGGWGGPEEDQELVEDEMDKGEERERKRKDEDEEGVENNGRGKGSKEKGKRW